jgi:hypothetical protein
MSDARPAWVTPALAALAAAVLAFVVVRAVGAPAPAPPAPPVDPACADELQSFRDRNAQAREGIRAANELRQQIESAPLPEAREP